jgi:hypothetical protein
MAEHKEEHESVMESVMDKISDKFHGDGDSSSSSSDSDDDKKKGSSSSAAAAAKSKIYRLFGREKPVHAVLGGGKRKPLPQLSVLVQIRKFWCRSDRSDLVYSCFISNCCYYFIDRSSFGRIGSVILACSRALLGGFIVRPYAASSRFGCLIRLINN